MLGRLSSIMRSISLPLFVVPILLTAQTWTQLPDLPGSGRSNAACFNLWDGALYVGTGLDPNGQPTSDWYKFDIAAQTWSAIAPLPASPRWGCSAWRDGFKGWLFGGYDADGPLNELWEYDPIPNEWTQRASLPGPGRYLAAGTCDVLSSPRVSGGILDGGMLTNECWSYDRWEDEWSIRTDIPGPARRSAAVFESTIIGGIDADMNVLSDAWTYDANYWYPSALGTSPAPRYGASLAVGVLVGGSSNDTLIHNDVWRYDSDGATWEQYPSFPPGPRTAGVMSSWPLAVYYGTGTDGTEVHNDWWMLNAPISEGIEDRETSIAIGLAPIPADQELHLSLLHPSINTTITILSADGRVAYNERTSAASPTIRTSDLPSGSYVIVVQSEKGRAQKQFIVVHS
jgi:hypothetical protein